MPANLPARRPRRDHVRFYDSPQEAEQAGLRACFRCKPAGVADGPRLVERVCRHIEAHSDEKITLAKLSQAAGLSPFHLQRVFKSEMGISPRQYLESLRFAKFKQGLRTSRQQAQTRKLPGGKRRGDRTRSSMPVTARPAVFTKQRARNSA